MNSFDHINKELEELIATWEIKLQDLPTDIITKRKNIQNRTIKQIVGHMVDSASNNTHRIVHLQYRTSPCDFPNYATNGNNDRWIAIQNYQEEDWSNLIQLWKYSNKHIIHVINNVDSEKLTNQWFYNETRLITLREMIIDYLRHFKLHLSEIEELIDND